MEDILLVHRKSNQIFSELPVETALWKTCLRQILFCHESDFGLLAESIQAGDQVLRGEKALSLLLEILCGLHSPIVGETEVFGQFKAFVESNRLAQNSLFAENRKWLQFVFAEVKRTRAEHLVGLGSQSYGSLLRKYTRAQGSITICGGGQLTQEILPWLSHKTALQAICRTPQKLEVLNHKIPHLKINQLNEAFVHGEALVIAAPVSDAWILELMSRQETRPLAVYDLRGEENQLQQLLQEQFPHVTFMGLQRFFSEIEDIKKDSQLKILALKAQLLEKAQAFIQRTELRPLGWDDLCA